MSSLPLEDLTRVAEAAADRARPEILSRFRRVVAERKADGSPVTEADRAAEQAIRETLREARPDFGILGEEFGAEGPPSGAPTGAPTGAVWVVDPIDGTIAFSRGIPLFATLIALLVDGEPVLGLIDLPTLDERYSGWLGGGCRRNGAPVRVSDRKDLDGALVAHGDLFVFERIGRADAFGRLAAAVPMLRGYTDAFGHAQVLGGGIDAMVDADLNPWDAAATRVLVPEAGGTCAVLPEGGDKVGLVFGSPGVVDRLLDLLR